MESIRALARAGHVVACTIHQPRQAIVEPWRTFVGWVEIWVLQVTVVTVTPLLCISAKFKEPRGRKTDLMFR